jgi:uncharacterized protein DUF6335
MAERRHHVKRRRSRPQDSGSTGHLLEMLQEREAHHEVTPVLCGGDVDADWARAESAGDEAVGGSTATPDQDVVDELGRALGVEQETDAELRTTGDILRDRDRFRWHLEALAADVEDGRPRRRSRPR